ncbi:MAG TPA: hypothetical protein G4O00_08575 [Thermoflexia bacterium]|jgi:hypothetical protein|nr:hypothetical protein [Thermoflexia bacterium]
MLGWIRAVAQVLGVDPLLVAMALGGLVVAVMGQTVFIMRRWKSTVEAAYRPQTAYTTKTPAQVVEESRAAQRKLTCCQFVLFFSLLVGGLFFLGWLDEAWAGLWTLVGYLYRLLLGTP